MVCLDTPDFSASSASDSDCRSRIARRPTNDATPSCPPYWRKHTRVVINSTPTRARHIIIYLVSSRHQLVSNRGEDGMAKTEREMIGGAIDRARGRQALVHFLAT